LEGNLTNLGWQRRMRAREGDHERAGLEVCQGSTGFELYNRKRNREAESSNPKVKGKFHRDKSSDKKIKRENKNNLLIARCIPMTHRLALSNLSKTDRPLTDTAQDEL
jgi:hypothetical protein